MRPKIETKKYVLAFVITMIVFFGALAVSNRFSERRLAEIKDVESNISLNILSLETQFALLKEFSCKAIDHSTAFSEELNNLSQKLSYMEENLGGANTEVTSLKKYYSILQAKDYLLVQQLKAKCGVKLITVIYFYSNNSDCADCKKEGFVLERLREEYPEIRVYSFDYNLDISVVKTMKSIYGVKNTLPALIVGENIHYGFQSTEDLEKIIPQLKKYRSQRAAAEAAKTATSTVR